MGITLDRFHKVSSAGTVVCLTLLAIVGAAAPARAQYVEIQSFEVTPFIGARLGGTFATQADATAPVQATLEDAASYGFSAGVRFDDFSLIEVRWTRATSTFPWAFSTRLSKPTRRHVSSPCWAQSTTTMPACPKAWCGST